MGCYCYKYNCNRSNNSSMRLFGEDGMSSMMSKFLGEKDGGLKVTDGCFLVKGKDGITSLNSNQFTVDKPKNLEKQEVKS